MENKGYVYVLINPTMPGISKVGKTTRDPQNRVEELSVATGVATPFVLVYKELFADCSFAETYIHQILEDRGYRVSENREFFTAPLDEVIKTIQKAKHSLNIDIKDKSQNTNDFEEAYAYNIFQQAKAHYYGEDNCLQDCNEAMNLFKKAIRVGDINSYLYLGVMYSSGEGCSEDMVTALKYFKEGSIKGNNYCNAEMGMTFMAAYYNNVHIENGKKCWCLYFNNLDINKISFKDIRYFVNYIELLQSGASMPKNSEILSFNKYRILESINESRSCYIEDSCAKYREYHIERYNNYQKYIEENLIEPKETNYNEYRNRLNMEIKDVQELDGFPNSTFFIVDVYRGSFNKGQKVKVLSDNKNESIVIGYIYTDLGLVSDCSYGEKNVGILINGPIEQNKIIRIGNFIVDED
ncbi:GIY-YIG nuclease family protein [Herbivorax sp. ANBcel31]|uniref:GIY-YIG nuclease family protein n=1 Tax=Herbivorax sp. ANBcel31 TaxID=3069754 RepID=UPI0027B2B8F8|nr:GIY-YIG nuclease family protein [Herbivorax sp. ANBcel31]MDQ2087962.1 GIY-YIG nuclease family protein [Herbivorax sp. ANBcel31]